MMTILVDAWNTFVLEEGIDQEMYNLLEEYANPKIVVTNANDEQIIEFGMEDLPYELFTLKHDPDKPDPKYFETLLENYDLDSEKVIYFEHSAEAVKSARSLGITTYHFDKEKRDLNELKRFLDENLK